MCFTLPNGFSKEERQVEDMPIDNPLINSLFSVVGGAASNCSIVEQRGQKVGDNGWLVAGGARGGV